MKRLITGASGFIGSYLVRHLKSLAPKEPILGLGLKEGDLTDSQYATRTILDFSPDEIYHLAGRAQVADNFGVADYFPGNFLTTLSIAEAAAALKKPVRIFFSSSVHVYGNREGVVDETLSPQPLSGYGFTKFLAEEVFRNYSRMYPQLRVAIARLSNCIGPDQPVGFVAADLCQKIALLPEDNSVPLEVGPLTGVRTFLDVRDAVQLFPKLLDVLSDACRFEIFNVASPNEMSINDVLAILLEISGHKPQVRPASGTPPNIFSGLSVSTEKLNRVVKHPVFRPLRDSLSDMYKFCKGQPRAN